MKLGGSPSYDRRGRELGLAARPLLILACCRRAANHSNQNQNQNHLHRFLYKATGALDELFFQSAA